VKVKPESVRASTRMPIPGSRNVASAEFVLTAGA
jgi:hypothetical protein